MVMGDGQQLARALGWASIGLGLPQLLAPRAFAQWVGFSGDTDSRAITRIVGLRELTAGVGLLTRPRPVGWVWSRVAGDMMDLALLARGLTSTTTHKNRVAMATVAA